MFGIKRKENLIEYNLSINGMRCGMCEAHINNVIRSNFKVKKVKSNHFKNETIIFTNIELDENKLKNVINSTGYELKNIIKK